MGPISLRAALLISIMAHGFLLEAMGQPLFSKRYNQSGVQNRAEGGLGIEPWHNGGYLLIGAGAWGFELDGIDYLTTVTWITVLDEEGGLVSVEQVFDPAVATFAGLVNSGFMLPDGRYCFTGGPSWEDTAYTVLSALFWVGWEGTLDSVKTYGEIDERQLARQVRPTTDGGYLIAGGHGAPGENGYVYQAMLQKTLPDGTLDWIRFYPTPNFDEFKSLTPVGSGFYLGGGYGEYSSSTNRRVLRVDSIGDVLWEQVWGGPFKDQPATVTTLSNGNVAVGSCAIYNNSGFLARHYLAELHANDGSIVWQQEYGVLQGQKTMTSVLEVGQGSGLVAAGHSRTNGIYQGVLLRTAANGDSLWLRYYDYNDSVTVAGQGSFLGVSQTVDGGFICAGVTWPTPNYSQDMWVVKVDSMGCIEPGCHIITGIATQVTNLKDALSVWPNPARDRATVKVTLPQGGSFQDELRLHMVSTQGQEVLAIPVVPGENVLDLGRLASGLYYLHLTNGNTWLSGTKLIVE